MIKEITQTIYGKSLYIYSDYLEASMEYAQEKNIRNIIISTYEHRYKLDDIEFVKEYPFIENVTISNWREIDYSALSYLKNLKVLHINFLGRDKQGLDFSLFPNLEEIGLEWNKKRTNLTALKSIRNLYISRYKANDLAEISLLTTLEKMILLQSSVNSLEHIEKLRELEFFHIMDDKKLTSLKGLDQLPKLKNVEISGCKSINSFKELEKLASIESLVVEKCGKAWNVEL